jgi:hypothetical protein
MRWRMPYYKCFDPLAMTPTNWLMANAPGYAADKIVRQHRRRCLAVIEQAAEEFVVTSTCLTPPVDN